MLSAASMTYQRQRKREKEAARKALMKMEVSQILIISARKGREDLKCCNYFIQNCVVRPGMFPWSAISKLWENVSSPDGLFSYLLPIV